MMFDANCLYSIQNKRTGQYLTESKEVYYLDEQSKYIQCDTKLHQAFTLPIFVNARDSDNIWFRFIERTDHGYETGGMYIVSPVSSRALTLTHVLINDTTPNTLQQLKINVSTGISSGIFTSFSNSVYYTADNCVLNQDAALAYDVLVFFSISFYSERGGVVSWLWDGFSGKASSINSNITNNNILLFNPELDLDTTNQGDGYLFTGKCPPASSADHYDLSVPIIGATALLTALLLL